MRVRSRIVFHSFRKLRPTKAYFSDLCAVMRITPRRAVCCFGMTLFIGWVVFCIQLIAYVTHLRKGFSIPKSKYHSCGFYINISEVENLRNSNYQETWIDVSGQKHAFFVSAHHDVIFNRITFSAISMRLPRDFRPFCQLLFRSKNYEAMMLPASGPEFIPESHRRRYVLSLLPVLVNQTSQR